MPDTKLRPRPPRTWHAVAAGLSLLSCAAATPAATVTVDFDAIDPVTALVRGRGQLSYDDTVALPAGPFADETHHALTAFEFVFDGADVELPDLLWGEAVMVGGVFTGLDAGVAGRYSWLPAQSGLPAAMAYVGAGGAAGYAGLRFGPAGGELPEPQVGALVALALAAAALAGRASARASSSTARSPM
jgi:hypothetical protein